MATHRHLKPTGLSTVSNEGQCIQIKVYLAVIKFSEIQ